MQLLAPDILELTRQLSPAVCVCAFVLGLGLWVCGGYTHRFWLALVLTASAGIVGLSLARDFDVQPLVAGLLLALAAGALALALARISIFLAGGLAGVFLARLASPSANEFVAFLIGGLIGIGFYQLWITAISSFVGTVLMAYAGVSLVDRLGKLNSLTFAQQSGPLINWGIIGVTVSGILVQLLLDRYRSKAKDKPKKQDKDKEEKKDQATPPPPAPAPAPPPPPPPPPSPPKSSPWWKKPLFGKKVA
ncbi:MAG: hypothetical protein U0840_05785 [Gemmataceae bacterium]